MTALASDLAALQQGVDVALSLSVVEAVFGHDLGHEIVLALERGQILFGELAPLRPDFLENDLPRRRSRVSPGTCSKRYWSCKYL
jgi:hypothetical protein